LRSEQPRADRFEILPALLDRFMRAGRARDDQHATGREAEAEDLQALDRDGDRHLRSRRVTERRMKGVFPAREHPPNGGRIECRPDGADKHVTRVDHFDDDAESDGDLAQPFTRLTVDRASDLSGHAGICPELTQYARFR
jgi:hypothetical protein